MTTGAMVSAISASRRSIKTSSPTMIVTISTWLIRLRVNVTTLEKSCVSDVTRLTILPDENSS